MGVSLIGVDADDTLWHSETHFSVTETRFAELVAPWAEPDQVGNQLLDRERANLEVFGYGVKGFVLSMIETAIELSDGRIPADQLHQIVKWGKEMLSHPVDLLDGVAETLTQLRESHRLVLITKGDLFHQESKIAESGLAEMFDRIEILSEKSTHQYRRVLGDLATPVDEFVMVGNSVRSDILPVIQLGSVAVHVPYELTWGHEKVNRDALDETWHTIERFDELPSVLEEL